MKWLMIPFALLAGCTINRTPVVHVPPTEDRRSLCRDPSLLCPKAPVDSREALKH